MDVAILGGTGDVGEGLALRWAADTDHGIVVGSREAARAETSAAEYEEALADRGIERRVEGAENAAAARRGDVVVLAVPPYYATDTVDAVADELGDAVLVTPAVGMERVDGEFRYDPPGIGSVTELVADRAPGGVPVVGAFHNLPADRLADLDAALGIDVAVLADDERAKETVLDLAGDVDGLRPLDGGPLANAPAVESMTPLLINVARHNDGLHDLGVRFE